MTDTKTQHTPGPWWISGQGILAGDTNDPEIVAHFDLDDLMAVSAREDSGVEEAEANARLIAAAPDLLAACEAAAKWIDVLCIHPDGIVADVARGSIMPDKLRAAIARARGQVMTRSER